VARSLQVALADATTTTTRASGVERAVDDQSWGWLAGLTGWLRALAQGLVDAVTFPIRLIEILLRALFTAGSGLVAPTTLLVAFTVTALRDRRRAGAASS
jgi:hypothetical protein